MRTLLEILRDTETWLARKGFPCAQTDAQWLVAHALGLRRLDLYLQFDRPLGEKELARIRPLIRRRAQGEPVQYITGSTAFYNCEIQVGPGVLVPRPETERLVELALRKYPGQGPILDVCTGSGAILFALAGGLDPRPALVGTDVSPEALAWARRNAEKLGRPEIEFLEGDLFAPVAGRRFALITANPPYVAEPEYAELPRDVRDHEPRQALVAGVDGLDLWRRLAVEAPDHLEPGAWLVGEISATQGAAVVQLLRGAGYPEVELHQDYAHRDRIVAARR